MTAFLYHFACFDCQVSFKRPATSHATTSSSHLAEAELIHHCPNCDHRMAFMGRNFAAPPKSDHSAWLAAKYLWEAGFRFSGSGYHLDPPLPTKKHEVQAFIHENPRHVQRIGQTNNWNRYA